LTDSVAATPKSWFDCITAGENPAGSSARITCRHRAPAATRYVFAARSSVIHDSVSGCTSSVIRSP
jgi:hypothetical protein